MLSLSITALVKSQMCAPEDRLYSPCARIKVIPTTSPSPLSPHSDSPHLTGVRAVAANRHMQWGA
ncbi:uncharacterized protein LACBIDRAFT_298654 [Laccaria bicolor S238N-H82]|uniref:Predicted protein n=1 Tax=Laccaria bicolor (strain S238N-H82 / ATCC MYA-4686) TaxID=486041 RepID=B0DDB6_LACBS|nr:uncharacterized protein LACBIDRAFT_298654 [Laccaria bicolor S238N-H82]EDR07588.1 predicted protein [Laccaria bicolor S238N-H82]|eukprot:XP_001881980.1 predicted protein [Laccaria bicolor S238N-H82]